MKNILVFFMLSVVLSLAVSCKGDDADEPLTECPSPSYLNSIVTQVEAIQKEVAVMEAQLPNTQGTDKDALAGKITKAKERGNVLTEELSNYLHCF